MTSTSTATAEGRVPWRDELVQTLLATWAVAGLFIDGWAHTHNKPETFFSPWHGVLYSGAGAAIAYGWWARRRAGLLFAAGQRVTSIGIVLFVAGAVSDGAWHQVFGIEVDIEALLSPTHLLLMIGGILALTGPFRAAWTAPGEDRPTFARFLPAVLSLTLAVSVASFFWMYLSPFAIGAYAEDGVSGSSELVDLAHIHGIAAVMVANVLLLGPMLLVLRRWRPPFGSFALLFGGVATATSGLEEFWQWPTIGAAVGAGLVADALAARGARVRTVAWVTPAVLWLAYFAAFHAVEGVGWSVDLWGGTVVMATLAGLGLSLLVAPPAVPAEEA